MKAHKLLGFFAALLLMVSVAGCAPSFYSTNRYGNGGRYARHHDRYHRPAPPRPYGGYGRW